MKKWYFIVASIILFNPLVSIFDIFPDFIAYILLLFAFRKMAYIDAKAEDTCRYLKILAIITAIKPISFFLVPTTDSAMLLVYSFVFTVLESVFGFFLFTRIFETLSAYAVSNENPICANNAKIKNFTIVAHVLKLVLAMLPDLTELSISNGVDTQTKIPLTHFKTAFFILSVIFSIIIETVWLVLINIYTKKLFKNNLARNLNEQFVRKTENRPSLFLSKDSMLVCITACFASAFLLDFNLNLINIIYDSFFSIIIFALLVYLLIKNHTKSYALIGIIGGLTVVHLIFDILLTKSARAFFSRYSLHSLKNYLFDSREMYLKVSIYAVLSALITFVIVLLLLIFIKNHAIKVLDEHSTLLVDSNKEQMLNEFKKGAKKNMIATLVASGASSICYVLYITTRYLFTAMTALNTIAEVALIVFFVKAMLFYYDNAFKRIYSHS